MDDELRTLARLLEQLRGQTKAAVVQVLEQPDVLERADPIQVAGQLDQFGDELADAIALVSYIRWGGAQPLRGQDPLPME